MSQEDANDEFVVPDECYCYEDANGEDEDEDANDEAVHYKYIDEHGECPHCIEAMEEYEKRKTK